MTKCITCPSTTDVQLHHISYEPEMKIPLCIKCHTNLHHHGVGSNKPRKRYERNESMKIKITGTIYPSRIGTAHIPKTLRHEVGEREIPFIVKAYTALLFDKDAPPEKLLRSMDILKEDLRLRCGLPKEKEK